MEAPQTLLLHVVRCVRSAVEREIKAGVRWDVKKLNDFAPLVAAPPLCELLTSVQRDDAQDANAKIVPSSNERGQWISHEIGAFGILIATHTIGHDTLGILYETIGKGSNWLADRR